jgi:hypothetical protein
MEPRSILETQYILLESTMLTPIEALQQAGYFTPNETEEKDPPTLQLFLDFITTEALESGKLQPYTQEMSANAKQLINGELEIERY